MRRATRRWLYRTLAVLMVLYAIWWWRTHHRQPKEPPPVPHVTKYRAAAVAGMYYPLLAPDLNRVVDSLLANAHIEYLPDMRGLICPHAGLPFSGTTAAEAYRLLLGRDVRTVVLLMPNNQAVFRGAYVSAADFYRTPLGDIPVSAKARALDGQEPFSSKPNAKIIRPPWIQRSPIKISMISEDSPETWEHAGEVQLPFLQKTLGKFELLPIILGDVDAADVAGKLQGILDDKTLVIAVSNLSTQYPYDVGRQHDAETLSAIMKLTGEKLTESELTGRRPVQVLLKLAKLNGWRGKILDYKNSGDQTAQKSAVAGYAALGFAKPVAGALSRDDRHALLELARQAIVSAVRTHKLPEVEPATKAKFSQTTGCFVTLTKGGQMRGCVGALKTAEALWQTVISSAATAAMQDPRFGPMKEEELAQVEVEISLLSEPQPIEFKSPAELLEKLVPYRDGLWLRVGDRESTFLPETWAKVAGKEAFMESLSASATGRQGAWREPGIAISRFEAESFRDGDY